MNTNTTSGGNAVRVTPVVGADWLVRSLLPSVLMAAAGPFESDRLRVAAGALEGSVPWESWDRYAVSRLVTTLAGVRDELTVGVRMEAWAGRGRVRLVDSFGGPAWFRSVFFPELDEITTMVARTITVRGVGELLRECVNGAILLATLRTDDESDSGDVPAAVAAQPVVRVYDEAVRGLLARCAAAPGRVGPVRRPVVDERFRAVPARLTHRGRGWRGEFDGPDGVVVCPHVHKEVRNARQCAERIALRSERPVAA